MHDLADLRQVGAELAARVKGAEMIWREAACFEQGDRQRITHHQLQQRRCRRRQAVRAGFRRARQQQHHVGRARQRRCLSGGYRDQRNGEAPGIGDDAHQFLALARPRHGDDGVVPGDHAEIAVIGFRGMDKESRRAGRGQRRRDLRSDMAAFADAGDDDPAFDPRDHVDGLGERRGQSVLEGLGKGCNPRLFGCHRPQRRSDRGLPVQRLLIQGSRMHG